MEFAQGSGRDLISRRGVLALFGAIAATRHAGAAEQAIMQPVSLDHFAMTGALQRTDPRCDNSPISSEDAEALKQLEQLLKAPG